MSAPRFTSAIDPAATVTGFIVYADPNAAVFERACKSYRGALKSAAALMRVGFVPSVRATVRDDAGKSWLEVVELKF